MYSSKSGKDFKMTKNFFNVNFFNNEDKGIKANTISGTTANFKKASKGSGAAYEELCRLMKEHPTFELVEIKPTKHIEGKKRSYEGLNLSFIKTYIGIKDSAEADLAEFEKVKKYAEDSKLAVFPFVKKWFIEKFGEADENGATDKLGKTIKHFDMELAKAEISAYQQDKAKNYESAEAASAEASKAQAAPTENVVVPMKKDA